MGAYTKEENHRIHLMRLQERADWDREDQYWGAVGQGYKSTETEYRIKYRTQDGGPWFASSPFYEPLSTHADWTHDKARAEEIAGLLLSGKWAVDKQSEPGRVHIAAVRVIELVYNSKIILQREAPAREGMSGRIID